MSTGNVLIANLPTPEQYFQAVQNFEQYLSVIEQNHDLQHVVSRLRQLLEKIFLNQDFLSLVYATVRETESTESPLFNADLGAAIIRRLEETLEVTPAPPLQVSLSFLITTLNDLAGNLSFLEAFVDTMRLIINCYMEEVQRKVLLGYWFIFDSAPNHGKLGTSVCAVKSAIRKLAQIGLPESRYNLDVQKARDLWGSSNFSSVSDLFSTTTEMGGRSFRAPTNMVGQTEDTIRLIAYERNEGSNQEDIIRFCRPGEILVSICHHSPDPSSDLKEMVKLQCTHAQMVVGFKNEEGQDQVCTINSPTGYYSGGFTHDWYPMIFVKPLIPRVVPDALAKAYMDNVRTWAVIVDCYCDFPGDYNGGDPLRTRNMSSLLLYGSKCLKALTGDADAEAWLQKGENMLYCAELVYVALNLGIHYPLNQYCIENIEESLYLKVKERVENKEFISRVVDQNSFLSLIDISMAPDDLRPISDYLKLNTTVNESNMFSRHMAVQPASFADVIFDFVNEVLPRETFGQQIAPFQKILFDSMSDSIREQLNYDVLSPSVQQGIDAMLQEIGNILGKTYPDAFVFRFAMEELLNKARRFTAGEKGAGFFVPPSLFMTRTKQYISQINDTGLLNWQYIGHGLHRNILM